MPIEITQNKWRKESKHINTKDQQNTKKETEREEKTDKRITKKKTAKLTRVNPSLSVDTLNVNGLNFSVRRHCQSSGKC